MFAGGHWQQLPKSPSFTTIGENRMMPTRNRGLTPEQDAFIDEMLKAGEYHSASDAIRALHPRRGEDALKLKRLRQAIDSGIAALDRGDHTEVEDEDLDAFLDELAAPVHR